MHIGKDMSIVVVGINHKKAGLQVREKFSFSADELGGHYRALKGYPGIQEVFILSTCNRVELYAAGGDAKYVADVLKDFICRVRQVQPDFFDEYFYCKSDNEVVAHLFRVASGLDSMVIGESQIIGQIKKAYDRANDAGVIGACLHKTLQDALRVSKKVRHSTGICRGVTSISGVVVELIKKEAGLENKKVLVIGAGKIGAMTVAKLSSLALAEITVINRDRATAEELKKKSKVRIADLRMLPHEVFSADIVIAATAAPHIINREMIEALLLARRTELLCIDLGVPRNIDETVRGLSRLRLYNIDDLAPIIDQTIRTRALEAAKAEKIIQGELALADMVTVGQAPASMQLCAR